MTRHCSVPSDPVSVCYKLFIGRETLFFWAVIMFSMFSFSQDVFICFVILPSRFLLNIVILQLNGNFGTCLLHVNILSGIKVVTQQSSK